MPVRIPNPESGIQYKNVRIAFAGYISGAYSQRFFT
jgi:hypothetical protein